MRSITHRRIRAVRLLILGVAAALLAVACGGSDDEPAPEAPPADGTLAGCRGTYEGTFAGAATGTMTGSLDASNTLEISAVTDGGGLTGTGTTAALAAGEMAFAVGAYAVRGTFDLTNCTLSGTWAEGFDRGTWSLARVGG